VNEIIEAVVEAISTSAGPDTSRDWGWLQVLLYLVGIVALGGGILWLLAR